MISIRNWLRGCVELEIRGAGAARFFTLASEKKASFWGTKALDIDRFTAWVTVDDAIRITPLAGKAGCHLRIRTKRGAPFAARPLKKRRFLWLGGMICLILTVWIYGAIWTISVEGCRETSEREILALLEEAGLKTGTRRKNLPLRNIRDTVMQQCDQLSYLTINFSGVQAKIRVWERKETPPRLDDRTPCDVISDKTGLITAIRVRQGKRLFGVGDVVQAGEKLATGRLENDRGEITLVHAAAQVEIRTWYTRKCIVPAELQICAAEETVRETKSLILGKQRFPRRMIEKPVEAWYDKIISRKSLFLREDFRLPVALETERWQGGTVRKFEPDREALSALLEERMLISLEQDFPEARLQAETFSLRQKKDGSWEGTLCAELLEICGVEVPLETE